MTLRIDPQLAAILRDTLPTSWATRLLFSSPDVQHLYSQRPRQYRDREAGDAVLSAYAHIVNSSGTDFVSFVSIGSGDGYVDLSLPLDWSRVHYFPLDISQAMVRAAVDAARQRGAVVSGLIADIEGSSSFLEETLAVEAQAPRLVACLGNMIGNVDNGERAILVRLARFLAGPNCRLILSVALGRFPRPIDRSTFDRRVGWNDLRGLLAAAIVRRMGGDINTVARAMPDRLVVTAATSDVPEADSLVLSDGPSGAALLHLRRYSLGPLLRWLEQVVGLTVVTVKDCELPGTDDVRLAIVLLAAGRKPTMFPTSNI